jgi:hypothetical protein
MSGIVIFIILIADSIVMGIIGALIGHSARRQSSPGFWWSFFLGPLGWIIVLCYSDLRPKCPECRGVIVEDASRCKNCGIELVYEQEPMISEVVSQAYIPAPKIHHLKPKIRRPIPRIKRAI